MVEDRCICEPSEILIFPCSGGSNVGQISNGAAVKLTRRGVGRIFCLAALGGHVSGLIESARTGKMIVAIDGCPVACAKKTLEHTFFGIDEYLEITSLGIEKNYSLDPDFLHVERVVEHIISRISKRGKALKSAGEVGV